MNNVCIIYSLFLIAQKLIIISASFLSKGKGTLFLKVGKLFNICKKLRQKRQDNLHYFNFLISSPLSNLFFTRQVLLCWNKPSVFLGLASSPYVTSIVSQSVCPTVSSLKISGSEKIWCQDMKISWIRACPGSFWANSNMSR